MIAASQSSLNTPQSAIQYAPTILFLIIFLGYLLPFGQSVISPGLDPSWIAAASYALDRGLVFGVDFVYTTGPLTSLYTGAFTEHFQLQTIIGKLAITFYMAFCLGYLYRTTSYLTILAAALLLVVTPIGMNATITYPILLFALVYLNGKQSPLFIFLSTTIVAALVLTKFSVFPIAVASIVMVDALHVYQRRIPVAVVGFCLSLVSITALLGQPIGAIPAFISSSLEVAVGFTEAMSGSAGHTVELYAWLILAGACFLSLARLRLNSISPFRVAEMLIVAIFLWLSLKAGFVRHDRHSMTSWGHLVLLSVTYMPFAFQPNRAPLQQKVLLSAGTISCLALLFVITPPGFSSAVLATEVGRLAVMQIGEAARFIANPTDWLNGYKKLQDDAVASIRAASPLPKLDGTVDIIGSNQSDLIANGLRYTPRPTVQEYLAYTPALIDRNSAFFKSSRAPQYLLFSPGSIDSRHPASAEGAAWPIFMQRYQPASFVNDMLLMRRRDVEVNLDFDEATSTQAGWGDAITVSPNRLVFAEIDAPLSALGRIAAFLFKPAEVELRVTYPNGTAAAYRLIPRQAARGFLISPTIETAHRFALLYAGAASEPFFHSIESFQLHVSEMFRWQYQSNIQITLRTLNPQKLVGLAGGSPIIADLKSNIDNIGNLASQNPMNPPALALAQEGLFAHAPVQLKLETGNSTVLNIEFGMRPGSYTGGGESDGVCFVVRERGLRTPIFQRCIDPRKEAGDRQPQKASVKVPRFAALELATECRATCVWDWSYWKAARLLSE